MLSTVAVHCGSRSQAAAASAMDTGSHLARVERSRMNWIAQPSSIRGEKWGPRLFLDQRSAPLASFAAIVLGRKDLVPCTHLLSINCRFLRISTRNSRLIAIASAV